MENLIYYHSPLDLRVVRMNQFQRYVQPYYVVRSVYISLVKRIITSISHFGFQIRRHVAIWGYS